MIERSLESRRKYYRRLSAQIARMTLAQIDSLTKEEETAIGHGLSRTAEIEDSKVFVKRIPVTDLEYTNIFSTRNFYDLPTYFSYGLGSIGLGVFRELMTHIKTTHWVLAGECAAFPLLYHYRIKPISKPPMVVDGQWLEKFINHWGNHPSVRKYVLDRAIVTHELVLFLEHIPHVCADWLPNNPDHLQRTLDNLWITVDFLRNKGIVHFDAHFHNILTDGIQVYLTDFGLAVDQNFALSSQELLFLEDNLLYDYAEILRNLDHLLRAAYRLCSQKNQQAIKNKYGSQESLAKDLEGYELGTILLRNLEQIQLDELLGPNTAAYVETIAKYRSGILLAREFYRHIWQNKQKNTPFPSTAFKEFLEASGILSTHITASHTRY